MKLKTRKKVIHEVYPSITNRTMITLMGKLRWKKILNWIEKKYGSKKVLLGNHLNGAVVYLDSPTGRCLGSVAHVEKLTNKKGRR